MTKKPNFFIVGAPRSGTTSLFFLLRQHPEVFMSQPKEPYYFCSDFHEESDNYHGRRMRFPIRSANRYLELFESASHETIIGEATPDYLYSKVAAKKIHEYNKNAKILISLRDPIDFLYSLHSKLLTYGQENILDFEKALEMEPMRRKGKHLPIGLFWPSSLYYSERIKFSEQIKRYLHYFPSNLVKIIIFDDFKTDNLKTYRTVLDFLAIDGSFVPTFKSYNRNRAPRLMLVNHIFAALGNVPIFRFLPVKFSKTLKRTIRKLNLKDKERKPLEPRLRSMMTKQIRPEVERLSELLRRDLVKLWRYD